MENLIFLVTPFRYDSNDCKPKKKGYYITLTQNGYEYQLWDGYWYGLNFDSVVEFYELLTPNPNRFNAAQRTAI